MPAYQYVNNSPYRTWEARESPSNWYGLVLTDDGIPVICGHGGSMWLCRECGERILGMDEEWPWPRVPEVAR